MTIFIIYIWNQSGQSTKNTPYLIGNNPIAAGKYSSWHKWPFSIISLCDSIPISFTACILLTSLSVIIVPEIQSTQPSFSALLRSWCFLVLVILVWTLMTDVPMLLSIPLVLYHYNSCREKRASRMSHTGFGVISAERTEDSERCESPGENKHCYLSLMYTEITYQPLNNCLDFYTFSQFSRSRVTCLDYTKGVLSALQKKLFLQGKSPWPDNNRGFVITKNIRHMQSTC